MSDKKSISAERSARKALFAKRIAELGLTPEQAARQLDKVLKTVQRYLDPDEPNAPSQAQIDFLSASENGRVAVEVKQVTQEPSGVEADSRDPSDPDSKLVEIPLLVDITPDASEAAGFLVDQEHFELEPSGVFLPDSYVRQMYGVSPDRVMYLHGRGRSMVPTIMPGQRVMVALLTPGTAVRDGLIYVINYAAAPLGAVLVKRLQLEPGHVRVVSDNPEVDDYTVSFEVWDRDYSLAAVVLETAQRH